MKIGLILGIFLPVLFLAFQQCSNVSFEKEQYSEDIDNGVGELLRAVEPVMAVRGSGCISCHANIGSGYVTDFGFGSSYYLGQGNALTFGSGSIYGDHDSSWKSSKMASIVVPATTDTTFGTFTGTLASYLRAEEAKKPAADQAPVTEVSQVYIGAPTASDLMARFQVNASVTTRFIRNRKSSPELSGLTAQAEGYYRNTGELICDGDLYVNAPVLLDNPVVRTRSGCRIYSTRTIFLQGAITYVDSDPDDGVNLTNLQLVSARAVSMGVGNTHCESAVYPGHYSVHAASMGTDPLKNRLTMMWTVPGQYTREAHAAGRTPAQEGALILADAALVPGGVQDASCFTNKRETDLERLLVNAPQVQSRYRGKFSGVIITEIALGSLSAFKFQFDEVFRNVQVLPLLEQSDFLEIR